MAPSPPSLSEAAEALRRRVARQVILASLICAGIAGLGFTVGLWFRWADADLWSGSGLFGVAGCVVALGASWALLQRGRRVAATRLAATAMNVVVLASVAWFGGTHTVAAAYLAALVGITALLVGPRGGAASLALCMAFMAVDYNWGPLRPESLHLNPGERLIDWWLGIGIAGTFMVLAMRHYEGFLVRAVEQEMRAREALSARKRADRFRSQLFAHSPSPVLLFDAGGALFEANQAAQDLLGDAPIGTQLAELLDWSEGQAVGAVISVDPHVPVEVRSAKVPDPDGDLCAIFALRDLRPQRLAEAQQRQAVLHAEASNRAKSSFLASVSHELRTPLNAILGYGEMLEEDIEDDGHQEDLGRILASGRHLLTLIDDVLDLSHVESGQLDIGSERVDLGAVLRDTEAMCRPMLRRRGHTLHIDVAGDLPGAWGDHGRLQQVLANLIGNAAKYTDGGTISVTAFEGDGIVCIEVVDDGEGLEEELLPVLFEPFRRGNDRDVPGTGLGLALARTLVEGMGGELRAGNHPTRGARFTIELPRAAAQRQVV